MQIKLFCLSIYLITVLFALPVSSQEDCSTMSSDKERLACYDAMKKSSDVEIIEKAWVSIEEKIIGKWGDPKNLVSYFEFVSDHALRFHKGEELINGTWAAENDVIIVTMSFGKETVNLKAIFEGDVLVFMEDDTKSKIRYVRLEQSNEDLATIVNLSNQEYINKDIIRKVKEGLNLAGSAKLPVAETFYSLRDFPSVGNNPDANSAYGLPSEKQIQGNHVSGIAVLDSGVIRITFKDNLGGDPSANGKTILLEPTIGRNKTIGWICSGGTMPDIYRPSECRKQEVKNMASVQQKLQQKARQDIRALEAALDLYRLDNYVYPTTAQGLDALIKKPSSPEPANWKKGGYLDRLPLDPWQQSYSFLSPGKHGSIDVFSHGPDKMPSDDDIGNWDMR